MANLTVKVHPVVHMTIVDAYERRKQKVGPDDRALGTLLGYYYGKDVVHVTNAYAIPFSEADAEAPQLDVLYNEGMHQILRKASPSEQVVGWFYTHAEIPEHAGLFHDYFTQMVAETCGRREVPPVVLITVDTTFSQKDQIRMPVKAFFRHYGGIPTTREEPEKRHCTMFCPLHVEVDTFQGEAVALDLIQKGTESKQREIKLDQGIDQLEGSMEKIIEWLEQLLAYVNDTLAKPDLPVDPSIGLKIMEIVKTASINLHPEALETFLKTNVRDYTMIAYLASFAKTQVGIVDQIFNT
ncbi:hypothetical protein L596_020472 [Steinernema carpocapsae]|uniref:MPN domain-containing protein n=1 Tax=Steinernema carpocapsae TaxID=34508 RepID=A0A4U5MTU4_STECR|nr:hypothetical protein L596_020472 [Steinernema carpocapsae]